MVEVLTLYSFTHGHYKRKQRWKKSPWFSLTVPSIQTPRSPARTHAGRDVIARSDWRHKQAFSHSCPQMSARTFVHREKASDPDHSHN
uniref:Uncharacterized protein n=1 Tax=Anguilla anguilla TaxID=7936 RepID=A0A0E9X9Z9_ANGAN